MEEVRPVRGSDPKASLEIRKLELEIRDLSLKWWQRPVYIAACIPIVLGVVAFSSALASGYFDQRKEKLEAQIAELEAKRGRIGDELERVRRDYFRTIESIIENQFASIRNQYALHLEDTLWKDSLSKIFSDVCPPFWMAWQEGMNKDAFEEQSLPARDIAIRQLHRLILAIDRMTFGTTEKALLKNAIAVIASEAERGSYTTLELKLPASEFDKFDQRAFLRSMVIGPDEIELCVLRKDAAPLDDQAKNKLARLREARDAYHDFMGMAQAVVLEMLNERAISAI